MTSLLPLRRLPLLAALLTGSLLVACVEAPKQPQGLADVMERPAEKALLAGIRAYDDAQYTDAEQSLGKALAAGLASPKDRATANKLLAFIYCTSNRVPACEQAFRAARQADPAFVLTRSEAGHPLWGPVYKRVVPQ
ncbi:TssQ family T6SS-associated lipoprotein [Ideonella sp. BN130291]|uniref:TssQ family T6SS-associated lipoprotein n=1 Tax=Ideonella sp. BN130291 TaxID=3112940 RepID=UPI002E263692|nr:TssQ family T6SS-associated lipoprotein [Ideonella sp. BN130291]